MTTPASGVISMSDIKTEFGGSNPVSLADYYGVDTGVPESGVISLNDFYSKSASEKIIITEGYGVGVSGNDNWGYSDGGIAFGPPAMGSRSPTTYKGIVVKAALLNYWSGNGLYNMYFQLAGMGHSQTLFSSIFYEGVSDQPFIAADATFFANNQFGYTIWYFATNSGSKTQWNGSGTSFIRLYD